MIVKKIVLVFLFASMLFGSTSCNQSQKDSFPVETKSVNESSGDFSLSNKLYLLAPEFNSKDCESFGECDCCSSDYIFLDNENFICVDYCLEGDTFYSGKYKIQNKNVELKYNSTVVQKEYNWESETDTINVQPQYIYKTEKCKPFQSMWVKFNCKETINFKTVGNKTEYASVNKTKTPQSFLVNLKNERILEKLNIK